MRESGVRGIMYQEVFGPDPAQAEESMRALEAKLAVLDPLATDLQRVGVSPHAPYTVSDELFCRVAALGRPMAIHIAESEEETLLIRDAAGPFADGLRKRGIAVTPRANSPIALLESLGMLGSKPLLIHCIRAGDADLRTLAAHDCAVAHCPLSNATLGHGAAPLAAILALRIRTGLGSDSMASNERMEILAEAHAAAAPLPPHRALALATLGGAQALGLADLIGTLDVGKEADLAAFAMAAQDAPDPSAALLSSSGRPALAVVVAGTVKLWDHYLLAAEPDLSRRLATISTALARFRPPS
jgi:5-methylthioadenosine/S-adenosylhomocysteine deaminase